MQPNDQHPRPRPSPQPPPAARLGSPAQDQEPDAVPAAAHAPIRLEAPTLLVEARFRDITLASRIMRSDRPGAFWIGPARRADAPVNPAWLADPQAGHALVESTPRGLTLSLAPAMHAQLVTPTQRLVIPPDVGLADRALALPAGSHLRVACGEMTFELRAVERPPWVPRPRLPPGWRADLRYPVGVALALAALLGVARLIPDDPRALSLDVLGGDHRADRMLSIPIEVAAPLVQRALAARAAAAGGDQAPRGPSGQAGNKPARPADRRLAFRGRAASAREAAERVGSMGMLAFLDGPANSPLADVLADGPVLSSDVHEALGHLTVADVGEAYGPGGLGPSGTGDGGAGTGDRTIGVGQLRTRGRFGHGPGGDGVYGDAVGQLGPRHTRSPDILVGQASVTGTLDKEIIRREVRRHLNEVRFCYEQGLARRPSLEGRLVVRFTIAPTGRVLAAAPQSSTLGQASVDACVVGAVMRWQFPQPAGGGLAMVSYPFQLSRAGD